MNLKDIEVYWKAWVQKEAKGDPFSFLSGEGDGEEEQDGKEQEEEEEEEELHPTISKSSIRPPTPPTPDFNIDNGIPLPCQCDTPALRTICLQQLAPKWGDTGKTFQTLISQVDALEVSSVLIV